MYLVDTNVISAAAPASPAASPELQAWMDQHSDQLFLSVISVTEITAGIAKLERMGAIGRADRLRQWLRLLQHLYGSRILAFEMSAAEIAGTLSDRALASGRHPGFADIAIAATAAARGLTVLTRNRRHFEGLGVAVVDPFEGLPP